MAQGPGTNRQNPEHAILDHFGKQGYIGNGFSYSSSIALTGTSEVALYYLSNPAVSTSAFPSGWYGLFLKNLRFICGTATQSSIIRLYLNPTISGAGTPETIQNLRPASPNLSIAALAQSPTASANGTLLSVLSGSAFNQVQSESLIILDPGQSLLITAQNTGNASVLSFLEWLEF